ncbi:hypothetical protein HNO88_000292 [Novosphingobium chloroacetimidivorans]|uniref:PD-(D/E)XK endonuclease-like domain-containing protein n=1 Tax=Novosphingobium chloroacetimidivorans TaxID=1428314 RepID=A0A7W7K6U3_9SPHN|nr:hypothetical protein [Novosphingobium chloroacetimidivorans]MBB4856995.1 hypothetical protein [Novosphingobium chloroacetimidivorans]
MNAFERHGITHLSASSVNLFIAQPALWACSYLIKKRTAVGPAAHRGTAIEAGVEAGLFDPEMPVAECQKVASAKFHSLTRLSADARIEKERETIEPSVAVALAELRQYGVPEKSADGRQHKLEITIPGVPVPIWGYLDFNWPQHGIIVDLKTTARIPSEISDAHARQGALYLNHGSNLQMRFAYVSAKKIAVYVLDDAARHQAEFVQAAQAIERLLSLSDDSEALTRCFAPDLSSFYWGDASARRLAHEIWGASPDSAPLALQAAS